MKLKGLSSGCSPDCQHATHAGGGMRLHFRAQLYVYAYTTAWPGRTGGPAAVEAHARRAPMRQQAGQIRSDQINRRPFRPGGAPQQLVIHKRGDRCLAFVKSCSFVGI